MKKYIFTVLSICFMILIFWFSSQPAKESAAMSSSAGQIICRIFVPDFENMSLEEQKSMTDQIDYPIRKIAHASEYAVLGFLMMLTVREYGFQGKKQAVAAIGGAVLYAASDEFHQLFVPGRSGQATDVAIDSVGVICGVIIYLILGKIYRRLTKKDRCL